MDMLLPDITTNVRRNQDLDTNNDLVRLTETLTCTEDDRGVS